MRLRLAYMAVLVLATLVARETVDCQHDIGEKVVHILQFDGIYGPILVEESDSDYVNSDDAHLRIESYRHIEPELDADSELAAMIRALEPQQRPLLEISDIEAQADSLNDKVIGHVDQTNDDDNEYFDRTVKKVHYNSPEENLKNIVEQKQDNYVAKLLHNPHAVADVAEEHSGYIFVKTPHTLTVAEGERLLNAMSRNILLPLNWFEEIKKNGNEMVFKVNQKNADPQSVIESIISHRKQIEAESGLEILVVGSKQTDEVKIVSQSQRFKHELASLARSMHSRNFLITTVVICASLLLLLVLLLTIFLVRRRSYLRQKLAAQIMSASKDYKHDGSEKLIEDEESGRRRRQRFGFTMPTWFSKVSEKVNEKMTRRSDNLYTPQGQGNQRMHQASSICKNGQITPMNSSLNSTTMSGMADSAESLRGGSGVNAYSAINNTPVKMTGASSGSGGAMRNDSNRSSTSSWNEEPLNTINMDVTTGHVILSYMEEHLNDKNRLSKEWQDLCEYEAEPNKTEAALLPQNVAKNRYSNILPYDHTRVKIGEDNPETDYINASYIIDDDPKKPTYVTTQGPLAQTTGQFRQMIWEQGSVTIISLCRTVEYGTLKCNQYWPANGCEVNGKFEVHLVSEHVWCEDYLVRSFYLKNLETNQTRTVTQFHYLSWPENGLPHSTKSLLEFRRKVNKSYMSKSSPIIVHCNDGNGRAGTYILIDMVLNKIMRGVKEIDLAATLEFLRDQRPGIVKSKTQFEFSFAVVTEELQNMLKALAP